MDKLPSNYFRKVLLHLYRTGIKGALALHRRSEARSDGLVLRQSCNRLEISWEARKIHPWDDDLPSAEKEATFVEQTLEDTEAAIHRIFERLPEVDVVDVKVLAPTSGDLLASGSVARDTLGTADARVRSIRMRLGALGVRVCLNNMEHRDWQLTASTEESWRQAS